MKRAAAAVLMTALTGLALANPPAYSPPAVAVPVNGVAYAPGGLDEVLAELKAVRDQQRATDRKVDAVLKRVAALDARRGPAAPAGPAPVDGAAAFKARCAACHAAAAADDRGGGLALFTDAGDPAPLTPRERQRAASRTRSGSMPPPPAKLDGRERDAIVELLQ